MLLLIDNYDSFTWNLVHCIGGLDPSMDVDVVRNDQIDAAGAMHLAPSHIVLSPGPCTPGESGACREIVNAARGRIPVLGVCLGHQAIADTAGMDVVRHDQPRHGKTSPIHHDGKGIFQGLPNPFEAARYHSLIVRPDSVTDDYEVSAWTDQEEVMGLRWKGGRPDGDGAPVIGVQFHPESFLSAHGPSLMRNFLEGV